MEEDPLNVKSEMESIMMSPASVGKKSVLNTHRKVNSISFRMNVATSDVPKDGGIDDVELWKDMRQQFLPGKTKSMFNQRFKKDTDLAIEKNLEQKEATAQKRRTKGLFVVETATNAGKWMKDKAW